MYRQTAHAFYTIDRYLDSGRILFLDIKWVISEKVHPSPTQIGAIQRGRDKQFVSDVSKCIRTSDAGRWRGGGGGGVTSNFLLPGGMDVFWNDPIFINISSTLNQILTNSSLYS